MVDCKKGQAALIKKDQIHIKSLCAQSQDGIYNKSCNKVYQPDQKNGLNNSKYKKFMQNLKVEYGDLLYYCKVQWLIKVNIIICTV